jgi:hypothetical protein
MSLINARHIALHCSLSVPFILSLTHSLQEVVLNVQRETTVSNTTTNNLHCTTMSTPTTSSSSIRPRGNSRGGLGKYLRARGRGHRGGGKPAEFRERLVLEDERPIEDGDEAILEQEQKFSKRQLGTNADRYKEEEPELGSDGALLQCIHENNLC